MGDSSCREIEGPDAAASSVTKHTYGLTSKAADCSDQGFSANDEVLSKKTQEQSSQKTWDESTNAEGGVDHSKFDSSKTDVLVLDGQSAKAGSSAPSDRGDSAGSTATGTVLQENLGDVQSPAVLANSDTGRGKTLPEKGSCIDDWGLATMKLKIARRRGD